MAIPNEKITNATAKHLLQNTLHRENERCLAAII